MSQAPTPVRFLVEDFQEAPEWLQRIFTPLNRFTEQTISSFNGGISLVENIAARRYQTNYTTNTNYATGTFPVISFSWAYPELPSAVFITMIRHVDQTPFLGSVGTPQWIFSRGYILVNYIPGLVANKEYTFNFLAI